MVPRRDTITTILAHLGVTALTLSCRGAEAPEGGTAPVSTLKVETVLPASASAAPPPPPRVDAPPPPPVDAPPPRADVLPPATATARPLASAAPTSPPAASASRRTTAGGLGQPCGPHEACSSGLFCQRSFTGAGFGPGPGTCIDHPPIYEGRPLVVEGAARTAAWAARDDDGWSTPDGPALDLLPPGERERVANELASAAFEEHASIAVFARTMCELMALGAPAWLVAGTSDALRDEIAHARATFALLTQLGGRGPGPLEAATAPLRAGAGLPRELFVDVVRGGCVGETLAAHRAAERADATTSGALRAFYQRIHEDEARHAALAFRTARWLLERHPELRGVLESEVRSLEGDARTLVMPLVDAYLAAPSLPREGGAEA